MDLEQEIKMVLILEPLSNILGSLGRGGKVGEGLEGGGAIEGGT